MADTPTKITDLPIAAVRNSNDVVEVAQADGVSRKMQLALLVPAFPDLAYLAPLASPTFTGDPKAPTPGVGDNDTTIPTTAWVNAAIAAALGPFARVGDFWAYNSATLSGLAAATVQIIPNTVGSGNSGGWYVPGTGRYTPPAGRYHIFATCAAAAAGGALQFTLQLRKNGVAIPGALATETPAASNYYSTAKIGVNVDAGGSDYFDLTIAPNAGATSVTILNFGAMAVR
jgi:hypothetical protein